MKVLALTSIRSEYDLLSSLFFKLHNDSEIDLQLIVGGAHNSPSFGLTKDDIKSDGFNILINIESLLDADSKSSRLKSASILLLSAIDIVNQFSPDLIIYAGDREEVMIGALLGGYLSIPTLHFFGGDHATDGHIDNPLRHAVSKLSTCHFVSTEEHANRLQSLAEPDRRIHNIGSVALDKFSNIKSNIKIVEEIAGKRVERPAVMFIFHPVENEINIAPEIVCDSIIALIEEGFHVFVGKPNSDHGNTSIRVAIDKMNRETEHISVYGNLSRVAFVQLFKASKLIVGNSSAGLLEAASIPIPCINIGERQRGRYCADNVIFVDVDKGSIIRGIRKAMEKKFSIMMKTIVNPYGNGQASETAYKLIKTIDFKALLLKKEDPLTYGK